MRTLVLNKAWIAVGHTDWKRAFTLLCAERAEVLEYYEATVKTPREEMFVPAVIRLLDYNKIPIVKISYSKRAILERDSFECQYCGATLNIKSATLDHVVPRAKGGRTTFENTVASCHPCNNRKGSKRLESCNLELRQKPYKPKKSIFKVKLSNLEEEWRDYLPRKLINEFQTHYRNIR